MCICISTNDAETDHAPEKKQQQKEGILESILRTLFFQSTELPIHK